LCFYLELFFDSKGVRPSFGRVQLQGLCASLMGVYMCLGMCVRMRMRVCSLCVCSWVRPRVRACLCGCGCGCGCGGGCLGICVYLCERALKDVCLAPSLSWSPSTHPPPPGPMRPIPRARCGSGGAGRYTSPTVVFGSMLHGLVDAPSLQRFAPTGTLTPVTVTPDRRRPHPPLPGGGARWLDGGRGEGSVAGHGG